MTYHALLAGAVLVGSICAALYFAYQDYSNSQEREYSYRSQREYESYEYERRRPPPRPNTSRPTNRNNDDIRPSSTNRSSVDARPVARSSTSRPTNENNNNNVGPSSTDQSSVVRRRMRRDENDVCTICCDVVNTLYSLPCDHDFHIGCLQRWVKEQMANPLCPNCRTPISNIEVSSILANKIHY